MADARVNCGTTARVTKYVIVRSVPGTLWKKAPSETPHGRGYDPDSLYCVRNGTPYFEVSQKRELTLTVPVVPATAVTAFGSENWQ